MGDELFQRFAFDIGHSDENVARFVLSDLVNGQLKELRLEHDFALAFDYDKVTISASP